MNPSTVDTHCVSIFDQSSPDAVRSS